MLVRDIMTTGVHTIDSEASVAEAKALFACEHFHHLIVVEDNTVVGVVSERDILNAISPFVGRIMERAWDVNTLKKRIHQIMTCGVVVIAPDDLAARAAEKMLEKGVSCLPVVDDEGSLQGIVTMRDFLAWAMGTAPHDRSEK